MSTPTGVALSGYPVRRVVAKNDAESAQLIHSAAAVVYWRTGATVSCFVVSTPRRRFHAVSPLLARALWDSTHGAFGCDPTILDTLPWLVSARRIVVLVPITIADAAQIKKAAEGNFMKNSLRGHHATLTPGVWPRPPPPVMPQIHELPQYLPTAELVATLTKLGTA